MTIEFCSVFMGMYLLGDSVSIKIRQASLPCSHGDHEPCVGIKPGKSGFDPAIHGCPGQSPGMTEESVERLVGITPANRPCGGRRHRRP